MSIHHPKPIVDWEVPSSGLDAFFGDGATRVEKSLPPLTGIAGVGALLLHATVESLAWSWWQYLVATILVFDLVGGVVAYGLNSAKRFQHAEHIPVERLPASLVRNHVLFCALHIQPFVAALLFPGGTVWWGLLWYSVALAGVVLVSRVPPYLARPVAMVAVALTPMVATLPEHPQGFAWLPAVLVAKLVLGAVREEPYRPG